MNIRLASLALAATLTASPAWADHHATIVSEWDTVTATPMGDFAAGIAVEQSGEGYTVTIEDRVPEGAPAMPAMQSAISDVVVDGATVTFKRSLEMGQGPFVLNYTLTATGDALAGEASSDFGNSAITGTRAAAE